MKGVHRGDHVYVNTPRGPCSGEVKAVGKHGCTVHIDGASHKVPWDRILGHKLRVQHEVRMIDDGEDGAIVELPDGERRFVAGPVDEGTEEERAAGKLVKAIEGGARVIFKAGAVVQEDARQEKAKADEEGASDGGAKKPEPGEKVAFEVDGERIEGKVIAAGKDGATVGDGEREYQVLWSEIVSGDTKEGPIDSGKEGAQAEDGGGEGGGEQDGKDGKSVGAADDGRDDPREKGRLRKAFERLRKALSGRPDLWSAKPADKPAAERPTVMFFRRTD